MSGGAAQVSIGPAGQTQECRFRIRRPDGTTGAPFPFSITVSEGTAGQSGHGSDQTGFLAFELISDRETRIGTWDFKRKKLVGSEVVAALPSIEFMQELRAPNTLEIAAKYGQFVTYAEIPPTEYVFPDAIIEYLRALAIVQNATATPILIPDLTTVTVTDVEAATEAAALVSGQVVLGTWQSIRIGPDISLQPVGAEQEVDFGNHYQFLRFQRLILRVGEQELTLGTLSTTYLSARAEADNDQVVAYPHRNNTAQKNFSPNRDAANEYEGHVLARILGRLEDDPTS
jgi:hypothetical protein